MINKMLAISIAIILIMSSIYIGGTIENNVELILALISIVAFLYIIWKTKKGIIRYKLKLKIVEI